MHIVSPQSLNRRRRSQERSQARQARRSGALTVMARQFAQRLGRPEAQMRAWVEKDRHAGDLADVLLDGTPELTSYDVIIVNSSAGKDSQAQLDKVAGVARLLGQHDRVVVVHADLGKRVEWDGTRELAETQARAYGVPFLTTHRTQGELLDQVRERRMWPGPALTRYCTSDHKRGPILRVITQLVQQNLSAICKVPPPVKRMPPRGAAPGCRPIRVLNCKGLRAEESDNREKEVPFERDERASNSLRQVDTWLPIFDWTLDEVWERIRASGVPYHPAYDLGMPRLSCCFCIMAPRPALLLSAEHNPGRLDAYVEVEDEIGHTFQAGLSLREIRDELHQRKARGARGADPIVVEDWSM